MLVCKLSKEASPPWEVGKGNHEAVNKVPASLEDTV